MLNNKEAFALLPAYPEPFPNIIRKDGAKDRIKTQIRKMANAVNNSIPSYIERSSESQLCFIDGGQDGILSGVKRPYGNHTPRAQLVEVVQEALLENGLDPEIYEESVSTFPNWLTVRDSVYPSSTLNGIEFIETVTFIEAIGELTSAVWKIRGTIPPIEQPTTRVINLGR